MKDKKYLDKVLDYIVSRTKIDYENKEVNTPFIFSSNTPYLLTLPFTSSSLHFHSFTSPFFFSFSSYCRNYFGLTKDEIKYINYKYKNIINDKIENGK